MQSKIRTSLNKTLLFFANKIKQLTFFLFSHCKDDVPIFPNYSDDEFMSFLFLFLRVKIAISSLDFFFSWKHEQIFFLMKTFPLLFTNKLLVFLLNRYFKEIMRYFSVKKERKGLAQEKARMRQRRMFSETESQRETKWESGRARNCFLRSLNTGPGSWCFVK